jgi:hypothetical protein
MDRRQFFVGLVAFSRFSLPFISLLYAEPRVPPSSILFFVRPLPFRGRHPSSPFDVRQCTNGAPTVHLIESTEVAMLDCNFLVSSLQLTRPVALYCIFW